VTDSSEYFSLSDIWRVLRQAVDELYARDPDLDSFSSQTGQTEWNLVAHLAPCIVRHFPGYSYEVDVVKANHGNMRPDIVIHKRGSDTRYNLLVVEVKRKGAEKDLQEDIVKIREEWFDASLYYRFGAVINLLADRPPDIRVFLNGRFAEPGS
jgi:hypothetical protein